MIDQDSVNDWISWWVRLCLWLGPPNGMSFLSSIVTIFFVSPPKSFLLNAFFYALSFHTESTPEWPLLINLLIKKYNTIWSIVVTKARLGGGSTPTWRISSPLFRWWISILRCWVWDPVRNCLNLTNGCTQLILPTLSLLVKSRLINMLMMFHDIWHPCPSSSNLSRLNPAKTFYVIEHRQTWVKDGCGKWCRSYFSVFVLKLQSWFVLVRCTPLVMFKLSFLRFLARFCPNYDWFAGIKSLIFICLNKNAWLQTENWIIFNV